MQVEVSLSKEFPARATTIPLSASLRFKPKDVFSIFKEKEKKRKEKKKNQTQHLISYSLGLHPPFLFPSVHLPSHVPFLYLFCLSLLSSLPVRDVERHEKGWARSDPGTGALKHSEESRLSPIGRRVVG